MKKAAPVLMWLLFILITLYPSGILITACFGYTFKLISISAFTIVTAVLSLCMVALSLKYTYENKMMQILAAVSAPFSLVNAAFCIFEYPGIAVMTSALLSAGCCFYLAVKCGRPPALKFIALMLSILMILPIGFISFIFLIFGDISQNTIVKTVESPNGTYYAQVMDSDQGALGGNTFVDVYERGMNAILFKIEKKPQRIYSGDWGESDHMQIYWKNDECLIVNSDEYKMQK